MTDVGLFARMDGEWIGEDWEHQLGFRGALSSTVTYSTVAEAS